MLPKKVEVILNLQIEREDYSSQLYLSMASWAANKGFEGVSNWLYAQAEEERIHLLKLIKYVNERDGVAVIPGIDTPPADFGDIYEAFKKVLEHERFIS
ncbi:MAG: ferritin, partial [Bacteroidia bacterium]